MKYIITLFAIAYFWPRPFEGIRPERIVSQQVLVSSMPERIIYTEGEKRK